MKENNIETIPTVIRDVVNNLLKEHDQDDLLKVFKRKST